MVVEPDVVTQTVIAPSIYLACCNRPTLKREGIHHVLVNHNNDQMSPVVEYN